LPSWSQFQRIRTRAGARQTQAEASLAKYRPIFAAKLTFKVEQDKAEKILVQSMLHDQRAARRLVVYVNTRAGGSVGDRTLI